MTKLDLQTTENLELTADVLVIGGGPAGCWAALSAMESGATVVLAEKGYVGTSGATAAGNSSIVYTAPDSEARRKAVTQREKRGLGLVDGAVVDAVYGEVHRQLDRLSLWGYAFPDTDGGTSYRGSMRGVDYLRFLRQRLIKAGVTILDHSPATELLHVDGVVAGARGTRRVGGGAWTVRSAATVLASGGCAFLSGALGTHNLTGDGYLMAAELGARFTGMDFTGQYGIAPVRTPVTKGVVYFWATFFNEAGEQLSFEGDRQEVVANGLKDGGRVFAMLDRASPRVQSGMRSQCNVFLPFDRQGIDPFTEKFEISLLYEGTVRGTGGIAIDGETATGIPGLFAAGDAASREPMAGATSGGGGPNSSWALATGMWSGRRASAFARSVGGLHADRPARGAAAYGPQPVSDDGDIIDVREMIQREILPLDRSYFRSGETLETARRRLDSAWRQAKLLQHGPGMAKARETLAMAATARWIVASALRRHESRGIHRRVDLPYTDPLMARSIHSGGLDKVWTDIIERPEREAARS